MVRRIDSLISPVNCFFMFSGLMSPSELEHLKKALAHPGGVLSHSYMLDDGEGGAVKMTLWKHPGNDLTGVIGRADKLAGTFAKVIICGTPNELCQSSYMLCIYSIHTIYLLR